MKKSITKNRSITLLGILFVLTALAVSGTYAYAEKQVSPSNALANNASFGFAQLVIGAPGTGTEFSSPGEVNVMYSGSAAGLTGTWNQLWSQDSPEILGDSNVGDQFGYSLAGGDFNGDGSADLAIGVPNEDIGEIEDAGAVNILYGSLGRFTSFGNQLWSQGSPEIEGNPGWVEYFGDSVTTGDFNGDGFADLAIGAPGEFPGEGNAGIHYGGTVNVLYGNLSGLTSDGNQLWSQDSPEVLDKSERFDFLGHSLATGDFNGDGFADLAIGVPYEGIGEGDEEISGAGAVNVLYGSSGGLTSHGNQLWSQESLEILGEPNASDQFGWSLTGGDFNGDGFADLAVGVPGEDFGEIERAGAVNILYGSRDGLTGVGNQLWTQHSPEILGEPEANDNFGDSMTGGDFNGDGFADLAVGVPYEDIGEGDQEISGAGAVNVLFGSLNGLTGNNNQLWTQDSSGIIGKSEPGDWLGYSVAGGDLDGDGFADLAIGVPGEDLGEGNEKIDDAGAINVLYGSPDGLTQAGNQLWTQNSSGIIGKPESGDWLGYSVAVLQSRIQLSFTPLIMRP